MINIDHTFLRDLFERVQGVGAAEIVATWRKKLGHELTKCETCPYEQMLGRPCCCMCLESNLANTSLSLHLTQQEDTQVNKLMSNVRMYRAKQCSHCDQFRS